MVTWCVSRMFIHSYHAAALFVSAAVITGSARGALPVRGDAVAAYASSDIDWP